MLPAATSQSLLRPRRLYSTLKAVMGEPPLARGIHVTYTDDSDAVDIVGRSGASGTERGNLVTRGLEAAEI